MRDRESEAASERLEDLIGGQGDSSGHQSYHYLAAWLRENRRLNRERFDRVEAAVGKTLEQQEKTNGHVGDLDERVSDIEHASELAKMLRQERKAWEQERQEQEGKATEGRRWRLDFVAGIVAALCLVAGSLVGGIGAALGWW